MSTIRTRTIAITPSLERWLRWVANAEETTAETIINVEVTGALLARYPKLAAIEAEYETAQAKNWKEASDKLKESL